MGPPAEPLARSGPPLAVRRDTHRRDIERIAEHCETEHVNVVAVDVIAPLYALLGLSEKRTPTRSTSCSATSPRSAGR